MNLIAGGDGIIAKASKAVEETKKSSIKSQIELTIAQWYMEYYTSGIELEGRSELLDNGSKITYYSAQIIYEDNEQTYIANLEDGKIETLEIATTKNSQYYNSRHPELHTPNGFSYLTGTVDTGYVIQDSVGNEFVWIPVASKNLYTKRMGSANIYLTSNNEMNNYTLSEVIAGEKLGVDYILNEKVTTDENGYQVLSLEKNMTAEEVVINKVGGFWVGRYETGVSSIEHGVLFGLTSGNDDIHYNESNSYWDTQSISIKKGNEPVRAITQVEALKLANNFYIDINNETEKAKCQSGLITGTQWDCICKFIGWEISDSKFSTWGNSYHSKIDSFSGFHSKDLSTEWVYEENVTKNGTNNNRYVFPTGEFVANTVESTCMKNLYDIAGNIYEWTTEKVNYDSSKAVLRGGAAGFSGNTNYATTRCGDYSSTTKVRSDFGFRIVLYVE